MDRHKEDEQRALELKPKCTGEFAHMHRAKSILLAMDYSYIMKVVRIFTIKTLLKRAHPFSKNLIFPDTFLFFFFWPT